jgi:hypothetical protein
MVIGKATVDPNSGGLPETAALGELGEVGKALDAAIEYLSVNNAIPSTGIVVTLDETNPSISES